MIQMKWLHFLSERVTCLGLHQNAILSAYFPQAPTKTLCEIVYLPPKNPYVKIRVGIFGAKILIINATVETRDPIIATTLQSHRFTNTEVTGPTNTFYRFTAHEYGKVMFAVVFLDLIQRKIALILIA